MLYYSFFLLLDILLNWEVDAPCSRFFWGELVVLETLANRNALTLFPP